MALQLLENIKRQGSAILVDREIQKIKEELGVVLYDKIEQMLEDDIQHFLSTETDQLIVAVRSDLLKTHREVAALVMKRNKAQEVVNEQQYQQQADKQTQEKQQDSTEASSKSSKSLWKSSSILWTNAKCKTQISLLDRKIQALKQEFGVKVYEKLVQLENEQKASWKSSTEHDVFQTCREHVERLKMSKPNPTNPQKRSLDRLEDQVLMVTLEIEGQEGVNANRSSLTNKTTTADNPQGTLEDQVAAALTVLSTELPESSFVQNQDGDETNKLSKDTREESEDSSEQCTEPLLPDESSAKSAGVGKTTEDVTTDQRENTQSEVCQEEVSTPEQSRDFVAHHAPNDGEAEDVQPPKETKEDAFSIPREDTHDVSNMDDNSERDTGAKQAMDPETVGVASCPVQPEPVLADGEELHNEYLTGTEPTVVEERLVDDSYTSGQNASDDAVNAATENAASDDVAKSLPVATEDAQTHTEVMENTAQIFFKPTMVAEGILSEDMAEACISAAKDHSKGPPTEPGSSVADITEDGGADQMEGPQKAAEKAQEAVQNVSETEDTLLDHQITSDKATNKEEQAGSETHEKSLPVNTRHATLEERGNE